MSIEYQILSAANVPARVAEEWLSSRKSNLDGVSYCEAIAPVAAADFYEQITRFYPRVGLDMQLTKVANSGGDCSAFRLFSEWLKSFPENAALLYQGEVMVLLWLNGELTLSKEWEACSKILMELNLPFAVEDFDAK
jgi:hypothetical protein